MLRLRDYHNWPEEWEPRGWNTPLQMESFGEWWNRCAPQFPNLDARVLEQWVYRHWTLSPYFGFPLRDYRCQIETLSTGKLVSDVGSVDRIGAPVDLNFIHKNFNISYGVDLEPTRTMNRTGTWDLPILLVRNPSGFAYHDKEFPDVSLWLIEGHQRHRYLRALASRGDAADHHQAFVLERPTIEQV